MKNTIVVIGGCRCGKSAHALRLAEQIAKDKKIFIATCVPFDKELQQRVKRHQKERGSSWSTIEVPILLQQAIIENSRKGNVILVDCLTLWLNNLLMEIDAQEYIAENIRQLTGALNKAQCPVILVSNEVGTGIVPENRFARLFRDMAGFVNQKVAEHADSVIWMVAGIPVKIK
ncbi:MAG: bifunctional adenosylcobinamide kinase/adenosylcobinamide-phosphate guanylyltransferase [Dissulfuribacterales bacterium]